MDVLSDVLRVVRLSGAVFLTAEFTAPWSVHSPPAASLARVMMPSAECFSIFHVMTEGRCGVALENGPPVEMQVGDIVVFPGGAAHLMFSDAGLKPVLTTSMLQLLPGATARLRHGGGKEVSRFVCGYLHCDQKFSPLFASLPPLLLVRSRAPQAAVVPVGDAAGSVARMPADATGWLDTTLRYLITLAQSTDTGNSPVMARLTELMFVEVLRSYMQQMPSSQTGWLAALNDPQIGKALQLLHAAPARTWTVEELAREVGASRSALAGRFASLLGESPMRYLASWRMQLAQQLLRDGGGSIPDVAEQTGYESEAAFNRAFKRIVGQPPAAWRKNIAARSALPSPAQRP